MAERIAFQDAKFGMFIHWGVYSIVGIGEWLMNDCTIQVGDYEKLPAQFNPTDYDPAEWVALAKEAGMRYITITARHHDGFAMFDSKVSDWDIVDRTPYGKDVLKPLADECHRQGLKLFFYYSHLDWHHPDYFPRGRTGHDLGRPESGEWPRYLDYVDAQLTELLTHYGDIGGIWFDGMWDRPDADWRLVQTYALIHRLQPNTLIGNNHHRKPFPGEDFQMWERDLPGKNRSGLNEGSQLGDLPLETCDTINGSWGYNSTDHNFKSPRQLVHYLARAAGNNANFLLNVGPMPNGRIQSEFVERLRAIGRWMKVNGDSIHETRGGPVPPQPWGVTTHAKNRIYVHLLEPEAAATDGPSSTTAAVRVGIPLALKENSAAASRPVLDSAILLRDGKAVTCTSTESGIQIVVPRERLDDYDTVIALTFQEAQRP